MRSEILRRLFGQPLANHFDRIFALAVRNVIAPIDFKSYITARKGHQDKAPPCGQLFVNRTGDLLHLISRVRVFLF